MLLDLRGFRGGVDQVSRTFQAADFALDGEDFRIATPVALTAEVRKDAQKVRVVGRVVADLELDCGRCLEPFPIHVDAAFDLLFLPQAEDGPADEREVQDSDVGVTFYKDDVIDLGEVMREQFLLALPMKPLCRPDCRGLCALCGTNRNRATCECKTEWVDPRLAVLKKLIE